MCQRVHAVMSVHIHHIHRMYAHTNTHTYRNVHAQTSIRACALVSMRVRVHAFERTCTHTYENVHAHVHMQSCMQTYISTPTCTHTYANVLHTHTYIHTMSHQRIFFLLRDCVSGFCVRRSCILGF